MSVHELILTKRAQEDFEDIVAYTIERWGGGQAEAYAARIDAALAHVSRFPEIGRIRHDIDSDVRSFPIGQHVVYNHATQDTVAIRRILHGRQDIEEEEVDRGECSNLHSPLP